VRGCLEIGDHGRRPRRIAPWPGAGSGSSVSARP
jgi:hypothetical protein